ncbi:hypothetical protein WICPIJ_005205 [Wickerhamomyces pijperi]|uniref:Uncharacterized protein n=1 Tax=Wickerhamomyces pijperi TaxID=599730 RepID=A0A9P8Q4C7_WICPI|nr:hypothetical protein WICPIJ_005205 [Wickerhamomyces pijperi]
MLDVDEVLAVFLGLVLGFRGVDGVSEFDLDGVPSSTSSSALIDLGLLESVLELDCCTAIGNFFKFAGEILSVIILVFAIILGVLRARLR